MWLKELELAFQRAARGPASAVLGMGSELSRALVCRRNGDSAPSQASWEGKQRHEKCSLVHVKRDCQSQQQ